jgi:hypothetical protein
VQLRTVLQDAWANQVEEDGRQIGVGLKFGAGAAEIHAYYVAVSDAFAFLDRGETLPEELAATLIVAPLQARQCTRSPGRAGGGDFAAGFRPDLWALDE